MIATKFGNHFSTIDFAKYCDVHNTNSFLVVDVSDIDMTMQNTQNIDKI